MITCDPHHAPDLTVLAFGGGVQSTALLVLAATGNDRIAGPMPTHAVFADPGSEHEATYAHVWRMAEWADARGVEVRMVSTGRRLVDALLEDRRFSSIPAYTRAEDGSTGILRRNCTADHKVAPLAREYRRILVELGKPRGRVDVWMGISIDEVARVKPSGKSWQRRIHPLIDLGWRRGDCEVFLRSAGIWPVPKSACVFCPFHSDSAWRALATEAGPAWDEIVRVDRTIRDMEGRGGVRSALYLHRSCRPIEDVGADLVRQVEMFDLDQWDNECEGLCGV